MTSIRLHGIKACVFDAYGTLFDVNSASRAARDALGSWWPPNPRSHVYCSCFVRHRSARGCQREPSASPGHRVPAEVELVDVGVDAERNGPGERILVGPVLAGSQAIVLSILASMTTSLADLGTERTGSIRS